MNFKDANEQRTVKLPFGSFFFRKINTLNNTLPHKKKIIPYSLRISFFFYCFLAPTKDILNLHLSPSDFWPLSKNLGFFLNCPNCSKLTVLWLQALRCAFNRLLQVENGHFPVFSSFWIFHSLKMAISWHQHRNKT